MNSGLELKKLMKNNHMTMGQLALKAGLNTSTISRLENDKYSILGTKQSTFNKIAKALKINSQNLRNILSGNKYSSVKHPEDYTNSHFDIAKAIAHHHYMTWQGKPLTDRDKKMLELYFGK